MYIYICMSMYISYTQRRDTFLARLSRMFLMSCASLLRNATKSCCCSSTCFGESFQHNGQTAPRTGTGYPREQLLPGKQNALLGVMLHQGIGSLDDFALRGPSGLRPPSCSFQLVGYSRNPGAQGCISAEHRRPVGFLRELAQEGRQVVLLLAHLLPPNPWGGACL